jgi:glycosyltransferase involved in cell wall biosynthesis
MRIVYVLNSLGVGGAERQALALADRMLRRGHSVAILALRPVIADEWPTDLRVVHLDIRKSPASLLAGIARACHFMREFRPDLIHGHSFHANILARLLKFFVRSPKILTTVHNVYEGGWRRMLAYRLTDSLACRTTAVSQAVADHFIRLKAVPARKCVVLLNGIDSEEFSPNLDRRNCMREEMAAGEKFVWLAAGRMVVAKDYPNLLRAFRQVRAAIPEVELWIAGEPGDVSAFAVECGSMELVRLLGLRRDMPTLFDAADGFVSSSAWEGMPLVVGEAMAMEKPVVATDVGGTREIVGEAGIIVKAGNSDALAAAMIEQMRQTAEQRKAIGRAARFRIAADFSMDARANEWESLYRNVVDAEP